MKENTVIGIEGLVGAGKTSICRKMLEKNNNAILLNGGNLYRTIVYALMQQESNLFKLRKKMKNIDIKNCMDENNIEIKIENRETVFYINGNLANEEILQNRNSSLAVSIIGGTADNTKLFEFARDFIDKLRVKNDIIISGRAIMQIYPKIDYHIFIIANFNERVKRKSIQYKGTEKSIKVKVNVFIRDFLQRLAGFYKRSKNTIVIDVTKCKSVEESTNKLLEKIREKEEIS